ncbi:MAG TPA: SRPBCC domain-containing protein [Rhizomicrobium sp.]|nr:SRPBCC domain-containing protein [Rhizomicrobium sp.]
MTREGSSGARGSQTRVWQIGAGALLAAALILSEQARAEVADAGANGFTLRGTAHMAASPDKVYGSLITPQRWWSSQHTFSGDAANMSLDAKAGGCWCETLPNGGSVLHMTVVYAAPGKGLRLRGGLGPFQSMAADGAMVWTLAPKDGGTDVTLSYAVAGYAKDGFDKIAHGASGVLDEQMSRLKSYVETGSVPSQQETKP